MSQRDEDDEVEAGAPAPRRAGLPVDVHRLLRALRRGRLWIAAMGVIGAVIGLLVAKLVITHTYEATASIRYEGLPGQQMHEAQSNLPSLVSIAQSEATMSALRRRMGQDEVSIDAMRRLVEIEADNGSGLVSFTTSAETSERAAAMANALVEIFLEHHRERRRAELNREITSLDERIVAANGELGEARRRYDRFREANRITDLSAEQEQAITQAAALRSEADLAEAEVQALEARVRQLRAAVARTPRMEAVSSGASDRSRRLTELSARLAEMRASLSDEHPQVQAVRRQIEALSRSRGASTSTRMEVSGLYQQAQTNLATAETELETARRRHEALERNAEQAQQRTNRFSAIEGQAATLLAQVNVKEALVTELAQAKARREDQLRDVETGFRTVAEALPPEDAVPTKKKYLVAAGVPLAFVLVAVGLLLGRELRGFFVETPAEVAWWGNGPVVGTTKWPRDARALIDLVAGMDDCTPEARGTMLIVAASGEDRELAGEIATQINQDWGATSLFDVPLAGILPAARVLPSSGSPTEPRAGAADAELEDLDGADLEPLEDGPVEGAPDRRAGAMLAWPAEDPYLGAGAEALSTYAPAPRDLEEPTERLICTAWSGASEGPALRRAARLADRVLVVVTSNTLRAIELSQMKARLGRSEAVGYVLVGVSDEVARLPDRAGDVRSFWGGGAAA